MIDVRNFDCDGVSTTETEMNTKTIALTAMLVLGFAAPSYAEGLKAEQVVHKIATIMTEDGRSEIRLLPATSVAPGDRIKYTIEYANPTAEPADGVVLTMPVPDAVEYAEGSAENNRSLVTYSVDGGASYFTREALYVRRDDVDEPALAADVTHIRWEVAGAVAPGELGSVGFEGVIE